MPTPMDVADSISEAMKAASHALREATRDAMREAGKVAREEMKVTSTIVPGADRRFSHWRGRPVLGVSLRQSPGVVTVAPRGPWGVAEDGARPHGGHPGTRSTQGRQSWTRGQVATFDALGVEVPERIGAAVEEAFEGAG